MLLPVLAAQTPQNNSDFSNSQYITDSNRTEASALTISLNVSNILNRQYFWYQQKLCHICSLFVHIKVHRFNNVSD